MHVHVADSNGDAKYWLEPRIELALSNGMSKRRLNEIRKIVEERRDEIANAWREHFHR